MRTETSPGYHKIYTSATKNIILRKIDTINSLKEGYFEIHLHIKN